MVETQTEHTSRQEEKEVQEISFGRGLRSASTENKEWPSPGLWWLWERQRKRWRWEGQEQKEMQSGGRAMELTKSRAELMQGHKLLLLPFSLLSPRSSSFSL